MREIGSYAYSFRKPTVYTCQKRVGVDEGTGHPRLIGRQNLDHEPGGWDAYRRRYESEIVRSSEAEASVVVGIPFEEHERLTALAEDTQARVDEFAANPVLLPVGANADGTEHEYVLEGRGASRIVCV